MISCSQCAIAQHIWVLSKQSPNCRCQASRPSEPYTCPTPREGLFSTARALRIPLHPVIAVMLHQTQLQGATGWLNNVPLSWLCQFTHTLPASSKLAIFKTSKWLARHVVFKSSHVTVRLRGTSKDVGLRRAVIMQLLEGCNHLSIEADEHGAQVLPFTDGISAQVLSLTLGWPDRKKPYCTAMPRCDAFAAAVTSYNWNAFTSLKELHLTDFISMAAYSTQGSQLMLGLCQVLESGLLAQVSSLYFTARPSHAERLDKGTAQRLARALRPRLKHLSTNIPALVSQARQFTDLASVSIQDVQLRSGMIEQLCEHPCLKTVTIGRDCSVSGNHSEQECTWRTLIIDGSATSVLLDLPLAHLSEIRIIRGLLEGDLDDVHAVLTEHTATVSVEPVAGKFEILGLQESYLPFVRKLRQPCELSVGNGIETHPVLLGLWQALPECVHSVSFIEVNSFKEWHLLWQGIPATVKSVSLLHCSIPLNALYVLVRTAPPHLQNLKLVCDGPVRFVFDSLHGLVPDHVSLCLE